MRLVYYCRSLPGPEEIKAGAVQASLGRYLVHHARDHGTDGRRHRQNLITAKHSEDCPLIPSKAGLEKSHFICCGFYTVLDEKLLQ